MAFTSYVIRKHITQPWKKISKYSQESIYKQSLYQ